MTEILMVPIHLDALYLERDRSVVETMADFSRLPYFDGKREVNPDVANLSEEILSQPFEDRGLQLQAGVHLHWALPDALTRGFQPRNKTANEHEDEHGNENERSIIFPPVPNRWLVTRTDATQEVKQWVVESDYLHPPGQIGPQKWISYPLTGAVLRPGSTLPSTDKGLIFMDGVWYYWNSATGAYVSSSHPQPFRHIGRKVTLDSWRYEDKSAHQYLQKLTAVGYGEPTFAAFYPNCLSVFGFHDDPPFERLQGVQYDVIGWYSEPEQDCLSPREFNVVVEATIGRDRKALQGASAEEKYKALEEVYRWVVEDPSGNPLPPFPTQTICYAHLSFEPDDTVDDRPEERKVAVAVGNTGTEALSAYLADFCARDPKLASKILNPADLEDQLEAIHLTSQFEGRIVDIGPKFREARHNKEFNGVMAGTLWTIRVEKTASGQANAHEAATYAEDTLPPEIATQLDGLNVCQQTFDLDCDEIESLRKQLFADWYKYMLCVYPPEGHRGPSANHDEVKYFIEKNDLFPLQRRISKNNVLKFKRDQALTNLYQAVAELQLLIPADIKDWAKFQKRFDKPALPEVERLCTLLPAGTVAFLTVPTAPSNEEKRKQTIDDLNGVLKERTLFETVFGDRKDTLTGEAHSLAAELPNKPIKNWPYHQLLRFNRLLLEAVFPEEITKSAPYALKSVPAPRYWQPNEPVVLIVDEVDQTVRRSPRHGRDVGLRKEDGLLRCDVIELKDAAIDELFDEIRKKILELRTSLTAGFTVPAVGSAVAVSVENTARMGGSGYDIFVTGAGYYRVASITDATHAVLTNVGGRSNAQPGTVIAPGANLSALELRTSLTAGFTVPAVGSAVAVSVENTARMGGSGYDIFVTGAGYYRVASITDATHAALTNVGDSSNAQPGTVIAPGANVSMTRPGFSTWTEQPWHPFLLEWEVEVMPLEGKYKRSTQDDPSAVGRAYDPNCIIESYQLKDNAVDQVIQPGKEPVAKESKHYYGRSILTPYAKFQLIHQIENFLEKQLLEDYYSNSSEPVNPEERTNDYFAKNINKIVDWYTKLEKKDAFLEQILPVYNYLRSEEEEDEPGFHLLAQSLSGFNEALLMQKQTFQLPVSDPLGFADYQPFTKAVRDAVGRSNRTAPQPHNDFNPIRTGVLKIHQLRLVDTFGQVQTLNLQENQVITTDVMTSPANPHLAILPPRIVQPARLNFRWLAGDNDFALEESDDPEMNSHPVSTPVCGWLLPNNLDNSLMVYDAQGGALGSLNRGGRWEPAPGSQPSVVRWPPPNPHLLRMISYLQDQERQGKVSYQGTITSFGSYSVTDASARWTADQFNGANGDFFLEIISGPNTGLMTDILATTVPGNTLTIADDLSSRLMGGERYQIRKRFFLDAFLTVIENALENIDPEYAGGHEALSLLMGRPIAVARASLNLEVQGYPAIDQDWNVFRQDMERAFRDEDVSYTYKLLIQDNGQPVLYLQDDKNPSRRFVSEPLNLKAGKESIPGGPPTPLRALNEDETPPGRALELAQVIREKLYIPLRGCQFLLPDGTVVAPGKDPDRETEDYTEVEIPIRIGEYQQLNDGLVGYWIEEKDGEYRANTFYAPQTAAKLEIKAGSPPGFDLNESFTLARKSNGINPVTQKLTLKIGTFSVTIPPGSFRLNPYGRFAFQGTINGLSLQVQIAPLGNDIFTVKAEGIGVDLTGLTNPVTVVLTIGSDSDTKTVTAQSRFPSNIAVHRDQQPLNITQSISSPPHKLTLLLDPRGAVHATSGILPTKAIQIPADQFVEALRNIEVTFLTAPILTDRVPTDGGKINLPLPDEPGYAWSWCEKENGAWDKVTQVGQVTMEPTAAPKELREGWLKLTKKEQP